MLVGNDHFAEQAVDEQRRRLAAGSARTFCVFEREAFGHMLAVAAPLSLVGLQRRGEIETAQHFGILVRVGTQQAVDELMQARLERGQLQREAVGSVVPPGDLYVLLHQLLARHLPPVTRQLVHRIAEALAPVGLLVPLVREGFTHHFTTRGVVQLAIERGETRDQVALGENQVDWQAHFKQRAAFLNAFAQALGHALLVFDRAMQNIGDADADDQAVKGTALAVLAQQLQKAAPLAGFLGAVHVTPGSVQQYRFRAEEPVAVARAAQARDPHAFALGIGEVQARLQYHRALAAWQAGQ